MGSYNLLIIYPLKIINRLFSSDSGLSAYLARGLSAIFLINIGGKLVAFIIGVVLARLMGPNGLGIYAAVFAVIQLLRLPTSMGMPALIVRYAAVYDVEQRWGLLHGLFKRSLFYTASFSFVLSVIGAAIVWIFHARLGMEKTSTFLVAMVMLPFLDLSVLRSAALQGLRRVVLARVPDGLLRPVLFLFVIVLIWQFDRALPLSPALAMTMQLACLILAFIVGTVFLVKAMPMSVRNTVPVYEDKKWLTTLLPFIFLGAGQLLLSQTDILVLSIMNGDTSAGLYKVAWQGAELVVFMLGIVNAVIQPMISRLYAQHDRENLLYLVTKTARLSLIVTIPIIILLLILGRWLLSNVFGDIYAHSYPAMFILILGQAINVIAGSVGMLLNMTGHERDTTYVVFTAAMLNLVMDIILIPRFGMIGAAVSTATSLIFWNLVLYWRVKICLGIDASFMGFHKSASK